MVYDDYSSRRVYSSTGSRPGIATSYSYSPGPVVALQSPITPYSNQLIYVPCNAPAIQYAAPAPTQLVPPMLPFFQPVHHRQHTVLQIAPYIGKGGVYNNRCVPHIAHQRLVAVSPPRRSLSPARVQQMYDELEDDRVGAYGGGLNYIIVNVAPTPPPRRRALPLSKISYIEDVTDHNNIQTLARETRMMRRDADNLMIRLNEGLPPAVFSLRSIPLRSSGDLREAIDIRRRYVHDRNNPHIPYSQVRNNIYRMSMYEEPDKLQFRGSGNLACLSYAGGRPIPKRRRFYPEDKIRDDVNFRSYYFKLRDAANYGKQYIKQIYQPLYRSKKTILGLPDEPAKERKEYESKWVTRALSKPDGPTPPPRKVSAAAAEPPKPKAAGGARQEVDVTLPGPRKSVNERPEIKPKRETLPEEKIVVKIPKKEEEAPVPVEAKAEETVKVPSTPTKTEEPAKAAEPEPEPAPEPTPAPVPEPAPAPAEPEKPVVVEQPPPPPAPEKVEEPVAEAAAPPEEPAPAPAPVEAPAKEEPIAEPIPVAEPAEQAQPEPEPKVEEPAPVEPTPATPAEPAKEAEVVAEVSSPVEAAPTEAPAAEAPAEPAPAEATPTEAASEDTGNKGEQDVQIEEIEDAVIEDDVDIPINEEVTMDEVCEIQIEENDLEIANPSPVQDVDTAEPQQYDSELNEQQEPEPVEPVDCELESEQVPSTNEDDFNTAGVSIVVADIDGPIEQKPQDVDQSSLRTVEEIQADAERRRTEFARLLEEHAEIVGTVQRLESEGDALGAAAAIKN